MSKITVKKAISRGTIRINYPVILIFLASFILTNYFEHIGIYTQTLGIICTMVAFVLAWLYWSIAIVKWTIWVYENVDDLEKLKKEAVWVGLYWRENHFLNKTQLWTKSDKEALAAAKNGRNKTQTNTT